MAMRYRVDELNAYFYTFSTIPQVLAAILAVTAFFLQEKLRDLRTNMQREVANIERVWNGVTKKFTGSPKGTEIQMEVWHHQLRTSERHGILSEMKAIFDDFPQHIATGAAKMYFPASSRSIKDVGKAAENGLANLHRIREMTKRFHQLIWRCVYLIAINLGLLAFTNKTTIEYCPPLSVGLLIGMVLLSIWFIFATGDFIRDIIGLDL